MHMPLVRLLLQSILIAAECAGGTAIPEDSALVAFHVAVVAGGCGAGSGC
jgi:hypothetical protein